MLGSAQSDVVSNLLHETRNFPPAPEWAAIAVVTADEYEEADADRPAFWAKQPRELLIWSRDFDEALDWSSPPFAKWFVCGEVNAAYNALDRHVKNGRGNQVGYRLRGRPGDTASDSSCRASIESSWLFAKALGTLLLCTKELG